MKRTRGRYRGAAASRLGRVRCRGGIPAANRSIRRRVRRGSRAAARWWRGKGRAPFIAITLGRPSVRRSHALFRETRTPSASLASALSTESRRIGMLGRSCVAERARRCISRVRYSITSHRAHGAKNARTNAKRRREAKMSKDSEQY